MKTEWDYTNLAAAYLKRPDYAQSAIDKMLEVAGVKSGDSACDIGAGAAHLTLKLAEYGLRVCAVEPNDAMRANGIRRTEQYQNVKWFACMWNHRDLDNPLQKKIENILKEEIEDYSYGTRKEDQTEVINDSGLFRDVIYYRRHGGT